MIACVRGTQELREIALRTALLEQSGKNEARHALELQELVARLRLSQQQVEAATRANAITLYSEMLLRG